MNIFNEHGEVQKGFAMMFKSLVAMLGFKPDDALKEAQSFALFLRNNIHDFDARLTRIEVTQAEILKRIPQSTVVTTNEENHV